MEISFNPADLLDSAIRKAANSASLPNDFDPVVRPADPRFGDYQANGVLPYAKKNKLNPREIAAQLISILNEQGLLDPTLVSWDIAGPGFINFKLLPAFSLQWKPS
jgi:arginyl-tRNA synthetase